MTRTEMLKKMLECYRSCKVMRYSDEVALDRVLEVLEENGMLPPTYFGFGTYPINKWEAEKENVE